MRTCYNIHLRIHWSKDVQFGKHKNLQIELILSSITNFTFQDSEGGSIVNRKSGKLASDYCPSSL
jgi:hypothetical protein